MAPEFEEAAKDLSGKVRFVKLDTDLEPGKSALVLFWHVILCVQYDVPVILPLHLTLAYL